MVNEKEKHEEIIVNAQKRTWDKKEISYSEVVDLAFPGHSPSDMFTVQYSKGPHENPQGTLAPGQSVQVKSGMVFVVTQTIKS